MAEEFQAAICGENWWNINPTRTSVFPLLSSSSTCAVAANDAGNYNTWQTDFMDLNASTRSCVKQTNNNNNNNNNNDNNMVCDQGFVDVEKAQQSESATSGTGSSILIDSSTLQMMGFPLSSSSAWNQSLFGRADGSNFDSVLEDEAVGMGLNSSHEDDNNSHIQTKSFSLSGGGSQGSMMNNREFCLDHHQQRCRLNNNNNDNNSVSMSNGFPMGTVVVNNCSYGYPSTVMQSLFDSSADPQTQNNSSSSSSYPSSTANYVSSQMSAAGLHFSNNTAFWNASAEVVHDIRAGVFASSKAQYERPNFHEKNNCTTNSLLNKQQVKRDQECPTAERGKKSCSSDEAAMFKRARIETPSPLPTFKVRKEKLGDRITALQQLVSPFGKTDTASVLHEAIEYIKFLHDQVNVLSTPYLKNGASVEQEEDQEDLRSRGLCLVPISSTLFPMSNESSVVDFWTPTFGGIGR